MPKFKKTLSSVSEFKEHIQNEFSHCIKDNSFELFSSFNRDNENIITLEPANSPLSIIVGYIKDGDVVPLYGSIQVIPEYFSAIEKNKTKSFDKVSIVSKVNSGNTMDELFENTFKTVKISDQKGKSEMQSPFLNQILKYIEKH